MKKEVKRTKKELKKIFLFDIVNALKQGKNPSKIAKENSISLQYLNYHLAKLKKKGIIEKVGYGTWEVKKLPKDANHKSSKKVRGHAYIFKLILPGEIKGWNKRAEILNKLKIPFILVNPLKTTPRIIINNRKIWLGNKSLTIYEPKDSSFYADNSINSRVKAVYKLIETINKLESKLKINLKPYNFEIRREHYALVKNALAVYCNKSKEKIHIYDELGRWLLIDDSLGEGGELETEGKKALVNNKQLQDWWNNQKEHNFKVTPDFILKSFNELIQDRASFNSSIADYGKHLTSHTKVMKEVARGFNRLTNIMKEIKIENLILRRKLDKKSQKKLSDYATPL